MNPSLPLRLLALAAVAVTSGGCRLSLLPAEDQLRLRTVEFFAEVLEDRYPFFGERREVFRQQVQRLREAAVARPSRAAFYQALAGVLSELRDPHISLVIPDERLREDPQGTSLEQVEGFELRIIGRDVYVSGWPPGAAPVPPDHLRGAAATLPQLVRVEGFPVVRPLVRHLLRGEPGSVADLELRWTDGAESRHGLRRPERASHVGRSAFSGRGGMQTLGKVIDADRGGPPRLVITTFDPEDVGVSDSELGIEWIDAAINQVLEREQLVVDLRGNGGGQAEVMAAAVRRFLLVDAALVVGSVVSEWLFGLFRFEGFESWPLAPREPVYRGAMVVLVDGSTGSAAEHFARLIQGTGRALVIGERTAGAEAGVAEVTGPDGTRLLFGARPITDRPGVQVQGRGVLPDVLVERRPDDYRRDGFADAHAAWEARLMRAVRRALR